MNSSALSKCVFAYLCVLSGGFNTPLDPLLRITQYYGWLCMPVCMCEGEIEFRGEEVLANPFHSAASYCLMYHSTKKRMGWRVWKQNGGAERDERSAVR